MTNNALSWWVFLCAVSAINVFAWSKSAMTLRARSALLHPSTWTATQWQMILSAGYVLGCAYRSVFPVYDVQRQVMFDSWLSSVIVGRSVATVAELCFVAQWALLLGGIAKAYGSAGALNLSRLVVPMIVVAETFSWYSVLTTSNIGHVVEESLWGLCAILIVGSLVYLWPRSDRAHRPLLGAGIVIGLGYIYYMFAVDVPMYWTRWLIDEEHGRQYLGLAQGMADVSSRWVVNQTWMRWESEMVWMSLYFSVAVWMSISLMHVVCAQGTRAQGLKPMRHSPVFKPSLTS
jgi:hypothetical protein